MIIFIISRVLLFVFVFIITRLLLTKILSIFLIKEISNN